MNNKGLSSLFLVVLVASVGLLLAISAFSFNLIQLKTNVIYNNQQVIGVEKESCLQEILYQIKNDNNFGLGKGIISLNMKDFICQCEIISDSSYRLIKVKSGVNSNFNDWEILFDPATNKIIRWQEK